MKTRVIVTRPAREAQAWVRDLRAAGLDAQALPLLDIGPVADTSALHTAWQHLADYAAVMFVSANAVQGFFAARPAPAPSFGVGNAIKTRAWATGPGTAAALLGAGVTGVDSPQSEAAQFDSEALWARVGATLQRGACVLIVRGSDGQNGQSGEGVGRDWLAQQVVQAGGTVDKVVSYQRVRPVLDAAQLQLAREAAVDGSIWLFSSSESLAHLQASLPAQDWGGARAVATHARIAQAVRKAGFGRVVESRLALDCILGSIESMR